MSKKQSIWVSALIPTVGADVYDGVRLSAASTEIEALHELVEWLQDEGTADEEVNCESTNKADLERWLNDAVGLSIRSWKVEECLI